MNTSLKLILNCVLVAAMVGAGIYIYLGLPHAMSQLMQSVDHNYGRPMAMTLWFLYGLLVWGVFALVIARLMLMLKPVSVPLYSVVAMAAFLVTLQTWELLSRYQPYAFLKELAYSMVVPLIYGFLVRRRNRKPVASQ